MKNRDPNHNPFFRIFRAPASATRARKIYSAFLHRSPVDAISRYISLLCSFSISSRTILASIYTDIYASKPAEDIKKKTEVHARVILACVLARKALSPIESSCTSGDYLARTKSALVWNYSISFSGTFVLARLFLLLGLFNLFCLCRFVAWCLCLSTYLIGAHQLCVGFLYG